MANSDWNYAIHNELSPILMAIHTHTYRTPIHALKQQFK